MKKILVILGHPDKKSYCKALADAYVKGAKNSKAEVRYLILNDLKFDPVLHYGYRKIQKLEPGLEKARQDILWAEHIVWVYPIWWINIPALLKGFLDRVFLPDFAFKFEDGSPFQKKLLKGKTAHLIVTMNAPTLIYRTIFSAASHKTMKKGVLHFCGIRPVRITSIGSVTLMTDQKRKKWISKIEEKGKKFI